jgi:hypothetical protein
MMEHPSRRSFLGMSSLALATATLAGLTANAQEKASTQKAEHDHSSSHYSPRHCSDRGGDKQKPGDHAANVRLGIAKNNAIGREKRLQDPALRSLCLNRRTNGEEKHANEQPSDPEEQPHSLPA